MFIQIAKQWVMEVQQRGIFNDVEPDVLEEIIRDYAERIENIVNSEVKEVLEKQGRLQEFERLLGNDSADMHAYMMRVIPDFPDFFSKAVSIAKKRIIG